MPREIFNAPEDALSFAKDKIPLTGKDLSKMNVKELSVLRKNNRWILGIYTWYVAGIRYIPADREFADISSFMEFINKRNSKYRITEFYCYQLSI